MIPKEKASQLVNKFCHSAISNENQIGWAKMNAIKCVDELIKNKAECPMPYENDEAYWDDVKMEIEKL